MYLYVNFWYHVLVTIQTVLGQMSSHKVWNIFGFENIALSFKRLFLVIGDKIATIIRISLHSGNNFRKFKFFFYDIFYINGVFIYFATIYDEKIPQLVTIITQTSVRRFVTNIIHFSY